MREWLLTIVPVAAVFYFVVFPDQLGSIVSWLARVILGT